MQLQCSCAGHDSALHVYIFAVLTPYLAIQWFIISRKITDGEARPWTRNLCATKNPADHNYE